MTAILGTEKSQEEKTFRDWTERGVRQTRGQSEEEDDDSDTANSRPIKGVIFQIARSIEY